MRISDTELYQGQQLSLATIVRCGGLNHSESRLPGCVPCMSLVSYKYWQKKSISRTGRASAETIYDKAQ